MNNSSLKHKAIKGVLWSAVDKLMIRGAGFIISIIIARILSPSDYGLIGMIAIFMALSNLLIEGGFSQALVQKRDRTQTDFSTAFFFNVIVGIVCYCVIYLIAPLIGSFYSAPDIVDILRVLGLSVILNSLSTVQRANLLVKIDFKTTAKINAISTVISGTSGVFMAYNSFGVWALVYQTLIQQSSTVLFLWVLGNWRPTMEFSKVSFNQLFGFGSKLLLAGGVATVMNEIYSVTIGRFYHASELGFYTRSVQTTDLISGTVNEVINSVTFPILSSVQDERVRMVSAYSKMLAMTAFVIFPVMILLAVVASPFVQVLLTDKWLPAVPLIQWLCLARMFTPISSLNMSILNAIGRSDLFMKLDLLKMPLTILTMVITLPIGLEAVVIGNFISTLICYFMNAYLPGKLFGFGVKAQFKIFKKSIVATILMTMLTMMIISFIDNPLVKLCVGCFSGFLIYLFVAKLLKMKELSEIELLVVNFVKGRLC